MMGCPLSKSSSSDNSDERIGALSQLSGAGGEGMFFQSGHELLTEKTVIWEILNFAIGPMRGTDWLHSLPLDLPKNKKVNVKGANWTFRLCEKARPYNSTSTDQGDQEVLSCSATYYDGQQLKVKDMFYSVKATIHGSEKKETMQSPYKGFLLDCEIFRMDKGSLIERHLSHSGSLIIEITLQVYRLKPAVIAHRSITASASRQSGGEKATKESLHPRTSYAHLLTSKRYCDIKIYSSDGKKFDAHKAILCGNSEVFDAMFKAGMREASTGIVKLPDMSSTGVCFLLSYLYSGNVMSFSVNGKKVEGFYRDPEHGFDSSEKSMLTVKEVLYIASKYGLGGVLDYVDQTFRRVCTEDNAGNLFDLSKMHCLECKTFLKDFIKSHPRALDNYMER